MGSDNLLATPSYWERETFLQSADVIIIGSGIVGLTAAIHLKELDPKLDVLVIERGTLPMGASTRNAGFACIGSMTELLDDLQTVSSNEVFGLVARRWEGLQKLKERLGAIAIEYENCGNYELFSAQDSSTFEACLAQMDYFNRELKAITGLNNCYQGADRALDIFGFQGINHLILNQAEGKLHTGEMMAALLALAQSTGVRLLNATEVIDIQEEARQVVIQTRQQWSLSAKKVLVATNGFARQLLPKLALEAARNQVLITKPIHKLRVKGCFHFDKGYVYFRNIGDRLLVGGARNHDLQTETTTTFGTTETIQGRLRQLLNQVILPRQTYEEDYWWSGILGIGTRKSPILRRYSDRIYTAVRMGGMGVAIGSLVGEEGAKLVLSEPPISLMSD